MNKNFQIFKKECLRIQREWGLSGWQIDFELVNDKKAGVYATINPDVENRKAMITFFDLRDKYANVKRTAKHEMLHLLLARYTELSTYRYVRKGEIVEAEEELIQMLLKITK